MGILEDLRDGKPCRWTGVCDEMSAVGGCTCGEAADEIERLRKVLKKSLDLIDVAFDYDGNVFRIKHNDAVDVLLEGRSLLKKEK